MRFSTSGRIQRTHAVCLGSSGDQLLQLRSHLTCCYSNQGRCTHSRGSSDVCMATHPEQGGHSCLMTLTPASVART